MFEPFNGIKNRMPRGSLNQRWVAPHAVTQCVLLHRFGSFSNFHFAIRSTPLPFATVYLWRQRSLGTHLKAMLGLFISVFSLSLYLCLLLPLTQVVYIIIIIIPCLCAPCSLIYSRTPFKGNHAVRPHLSWNRCWALCDGLVELPAWQCMDSAWNSWPIPFCLSLH